MGVMRSRIEEAPPPSSLTKAFVPVVKRKARSCLPPKGGLLATLEPTTLPSHEYRDKFRGTGRVLPLSANGSVVVRGAAAGSTGWLRRCTFAQYLRLVFSILDGL